MATTKVRQKQRARSTELAACCLLINSTAGLISSNRVIVPPSVSAKCLYLELKELKSSQQAIGCVGLVLSGAARRAVSSINSQQHVWLLALQTLECCMVRVATLADNCSPVQETLRASFHAVGSKLQPVSVVCLCACVLLAGALERNLAPMVATDIVPETKPRPVSVGVSGVAFPHPEKVGRLAQAAVELCRSSSCLLFTSSGAEGVACPVELHVAVFRGGCS